MSKEVEVGQLPECDFHRMQGEEGVPAEYDFKTSMGPWANGCEAHFKEYGIGLGIGRGQHLVLGGGAEDFRSDTTDGGRASVVLTDPGEYAGDVGEVHPGMACEEAGCFGEEA